MKIVKLLVAAALFAGCATTEKAELAAEPKAQPSTSNLVACELVVHGTLEELSSTEGYAFAGVKNLPTGAEFLFKQVDGNMFKSFVIMAKGTFQYPVSEAIKVLTTGECDGGNNIVVEYWIADVDSEKFMAEMKAKQEAAPQPAPVE